MEEVKCGTFMDWTFGGQLRRHRLDKELTLRRYAELIGWDAGNLSKLERGELPPPRFGHEIQSIVIPLNLDKPAIQRLSSAAFNFHLGKLQERFRGVL